LREAGYLTTAVVSGHYVSSDVGMLQGFVRRDESQVLDRAAVSSEEVTERALSFLAASRRQPFFLFVHYFDPHYVYQDHEEFDFAAAGGLPRTGVPTNERVYVGAMARREGALDEVRALYAEEIAYADLHMGRLLAFMNDNDLWASTCVIFVADHGEEFLDHGSAGHGHTLFQELIHVPLFVAEPSRDTPAIIDGPVETRWLFHTTLDVLGVSPPDQDGSVHNLFALPRDDERYVRSSNHDGEMSCLTGRRYKLIRSAAPPRGQSPLLRGSDVTPMRLQGGPDLHGVPRHMRGTGDMASRMREARLPRGGGAMLFDLLDDPRETCDLRDERPDVMGQLLASLESLDADIRGTADSPEMPRLNRDQRRRLRDLGYL
jgi:hypothetical protein